MKIETKQITKLLISDIDVDPISVILEDLGPGKGKITVDCFGKAWTAYWGGMGDRTLAEFFCSCDDCYIAGYFDNNNSHVTDYEGLVSRIRREVIKLRRDRDIDKLEAHDLYTDANNIVDEQSLRDNADLVVKIFGDEWWRDLPIRESDEYLYICKIIRVVQEALSSMNQTNVA
ncbi:MAG: hypothetical protein QM500_19930 [Methylococcales bacterium]